MWLYRHFFIIFFLTYLLVSTAYAKDAWDGNTYTLNSSSQQQDARSVIARLVEDYRIIGTVPKSILDIGCGDGLHTKLLSEIYPESIVLGIDPSASMLAQAEQRHAPNLSFLHRGVEEMEFAQQFDLIVSFHVLHWVKDQQAALKKIKEHLAPRGRAYLLLAPSKEGLPYHKALCQTMSSERWRDHFIDFKNSQYHFTTDEYRKLLIDAGLTVEEINYHLNRKSFSSRAELQNWVKQWNPQAKYLGERGDAFLDDLFHQYFIDVPIDEAGRANWREYVLLVIASCEQ